MKPITTYRISRGLVVFSAVLPILMAAMLILFFYLKNLPNVEMPDEIFNEVLFTCLSCIFLFGGIFILTIRSKKFYLYEDGIQVNNEALILFEKIEDVYLFLSGKSIGTGYNNLAFRTSKDQKWEIIGAGHSGNLDLFLEYYTARRVEFLKENLANKKSVTFQYLLKKKKNIFGIGARSFVKDLKFSPIILEDEYLVLADQKISYQNLRPLYMNNTKFEIRDKNNQVLLAFRYKDMLSCDVFRECYNYKVKEQNNN